MKSRLSSPKIKLKLLNDSVGGEELCEVYHHVKGLKNSKLLLLLLLSPKKDAVTPPVSIGWNSSIYGPSGDKLSKSELGNQLGEIKQITERMPTESGDSNNDYIPTGSKIFEIKGIDNKEAIAIEKNDAYYKFVKKASLK